MYPVDGDMDHYGKLRKSIFSHSNSGVRSQKTRGIIKPDEILKDK